MKNILMVLLNPSCWHQQNSYSKEWDKILNDLMSKHKFVGRGSYTTLIGGRCVWISNHPYASFNPYDPEIPVRPKRSTILNAYNKYIKDTLTPTT